jgi:signal transduction histidine kinase
VAAESADPSRLDALADALGEASEARITFVAADGVVLGDSELDGSDLATIDNHGSRPEVVEARATGRGIERRYSTTVRHWMLYAAVPVEGGAVVRAAMPLSEVDAVVGRVRAFVLVGVAFGLVLALVGSAISAEILSRSLRNLVENARTLVAGEARRIDVPGEDEIVGLAGSFNQLAGELDRALTDLAHERDQLKRMERVRRDFVANVSHELRTPVSVILSNAETLADGAIEDRARRDAFLQAIVRNADRLSRLITDLLDLARIEAGRYPIELEPIPLAEVVDDVVATLRTRAEERGQTLTTEIPDVEVVADERALEHVLGNLLDNALKYTPPGGHVVVRARQDGDLARIEVADDGPGVPEEHRDRLFERFYRVDPGRSREIGGTGLGLSIVKHLVQAMDGEVGVEPRTPRGSVFWFRLRRATVSS